MQEKLKVLGMKNKWNEKDEEKRNEDRAIHWTDLGKEHDGC